LNRQSVHFLKLVTRRRDKKPKVEGAAAADDINEHFEQRDDDPGLQGSLMTTLVVTPNYRAPELMDSYIRYLRYQAPNSVPVDHLSVCDAASLFP
jgi:hypothetical protein